MTSNFDDIHLVTKDEVKVMKLLLKTCEDGPEILWTNYECDSNQTPSEFIFNNNHLFIRASSKKEAAIMFRIISRLLKWWKRQEAPHAWLDMFAEELGIDLDRLKCTFKIMNRLAEEILEWSSVESDIGEPQTAKFPTNYKKFLKEVYKNLCDPLESRAGVVTRKSLIRFLNKF